MSLFGQSSFGGAGNTPFGSQAQQGSIAKLQQVLKVHFRFSELLHTGNYC